MRPALLLLAALTPMLPIGLASAADADTAVAGRHLADGVGYVSAVRLSHQARATDNGRLLLVFEPAGPESLPLYESRDAGGHWRQVGHVTDQAHGQSAHWTLRWQPHLSELAGASGDLKPGTLLLAANAIRRDAGEHLIAQDLQLYASTDGGASWHYRSSIVGGDGQPSDRLNQGVWEPDIVRLDDGRLVAYYSTERHKAQGYNQLLAHKVSSDGGRTWGEEVFDVAFPGGVERPGMAVVEHVPGHGYVMVFENIDNTQSPHNGQVHMKFSTDGLDWGAPEDHGVAIQTVSGAWPSACPTVQWMPGPTDQGTLIVAAQRAGGGGDAGGRTFYRNDTGGRGPWWEVVAPVQKQTGNIHAGWTQALLPLPDGRLLHVTSSSTPTAPDREDANEILYARAPLALHRYEAEDAERHDAAQIQTDAASAGRKMRLSSNADAALRFKVQVGTAGRQRVQVRYEAVGFQAIPVLQVNGALATLDASPAPDGKGWQLASWTVPLQRGANTLVLSNPERPLDYDHLDILGLTP